MDHMGAKNTRTRQARQGVIEMPSTDEWGASSCVVVIRIVDVLSTSAEQ